MDQKGLFECSNYNTDFSKTLEFYRTKEFGCIRECSNYWILEDVDFIRQLLIILTNQGCFPSPEILEPRSHSMHQACKIRAQKSRAY